MKDNEQLLIQISTRPFPPYTYVGGPRTPIPATEGQVVELKVDSQRAVEIEIKAESPAVFRFTAQFRAPGHDFVDFASAKDSSHVSKSTYDIELDAPIQPHTRLRIYFLVDGPSNHPYRIRVQCSQGGLPVGHPITCEGAIGPDGKIVFATAEATFI
jgi:hypothetical protein